MLLTLLSCAYLFLDMDQMHIFSCTNFSYLYQRNISMSCTGRDSLRMNNSELLISMTNRDIFKGFILKKLPKLPSCTCNFTSLTLPNTTEILKGFYKLFSEECFCAFVFSWLQFYRSNWKLEKVKKYLLSIYLWSTDHFYYYSYESPFPNNQESLYYGYLPHLKGQTLMNGKLLSEVQTMDSSIIKITFPQNLLAVNLFFLLYNQTNWNWIILWAYKLQFSNKYRGGSRAKHKTWIWSGII